MASFLKLMRKWLGEMGAAFSGTDPDYLIEIERTERFIARHKKVLAKESQNAESGRLAGKD